MFTTPIIVQEPLTAFLLATYRVLHNPNTSPSLSTDAARVLLTHSNMRHRAPGPEPLPPLGLVRVCVYMCAYEFTRVYICMCI